MVSGLGGRSRSGSVLTGTSVRDVAKRRDKPYRAEQTALPSAKKKKLKHHVSHDAAPPGYVFLPLGTADLAERCKEISEQRDYPVSVVNAKPRNTFVMNPNKVSYHIQRIGYHFRQEAVEEACSQLKYIILGGKFVSEVEVQKRQQQSYMSNVLAKYGVTFGPDKETPEQITSAIRETFPEIPDKDLSEIVNHAWEEGSERVGTAHNLDLSRRVQLAVIARIRHNYTDYDQLLKAFDWRSARGMVERDCLKKLIEWRGEHDDGEDDGLEEIVREVIVIDDEDDAPRLGQKRRQRDLSPGIGPGDSSDTSIEIVHRPAIADDLRAEDPAEQHHRYFQAHNGGRRSVTERNNIARAKIDEARSRMRAQPAPTQEIVTRINIDHRGGPPKEIVVDGVVMRRASPPTQEQRPSLPYAYPQPAYLRRDIAIPSIEPGSTVMHQHMPEHRSPAFNAMHQIENQAPRHGEPAVFQYRSLETMPPPTHHAAMGMSSPHKPAPMWSAHGAPLVPPQPSTPWSTSSAPLPPIPSAQPGNNHVYTAYPPQPIMLQPLPYPPNPTMYRPVHGGPAPVQPAPSNAPQQPYPQYWYGR